MKLRSTQFGVRQNTACPRQHAPRRVVSPSILQSDPLFGNEQQDEDTQEQAPPMKETFELSLTEPDQGSTGGGDSGTTTPGLVGDGKRSAVERPLTCEEAAAFVRVHPKTVKRMARNGELPGHFRFGRWFSYASELDCWMRTELHSSRHSCR